MHQIIIVSIGLVDLDHGKLRIMFDINTFIAEYAP